MARLPSNSFSLTRPGNRTAMILHSVFQKLHMCLETMHESLLTTGCLQKQNIGRSWSNQSLIWSLLPAAASVIQHLQQSCWFESWLRNLNFFGVCQCTDTVNMASLPSNFKRSCDWSQASTAMSIGCKHTQAQCQSDTQAKHATSTCCKHASVIMKQHLAYSTECTNDTASTLLGTSTYCTARGKHTTITPQAHAMSTLQARYKHAISTLQAHSKHTMLKHTTSTSVAHLWHAMLKHAQSTEKNSQNLGKKLLTLLWSPGSWNW